MKYSLGLLTALAAVWMLWSGHTDPFMLTLGFASCLFVVILCGRMSILDSETVPIWLGTRPFTHYAPWLIKEIIAANLDISSRILRRRMPIQPAMTRVYPTQRTELGRVILANSITLTPGTVSVDMQEGYIRVHALTAAGTAEDASGEMDRRVSRLEGPS